MASSMPPVASMPFRSSNVGGNPPGGSMGSVPQTTMASMPPHMMQAKSMPPMPGSASSIPGTMAASMGYPMGAASMGGGIPQTGMYAGGPPSYSQPGPHHPSMGGMPPTSMPPQSMGAGAPPLAMSGQYMPNVSRPQMTSVANPPVVANNMQYGPSYKMQYQKRSAADKTAVKYTGFLPLEGVYEEDTCRIG